VHCMERVRKYGSAVAKLYKEEGPASTKAAAYRARVREAIDSLDGTDSSIDRDEVLECAWQLAYYPRSQECTYGRPSPHGTLTAGGRAAPATALCQHFRLRGRPAQIPADAALAPPRSSLLHARDDGGHGGGPTTQSVVDHTGRAAGRSLPAARGDLLQANKFRATEKNLEGRIIKMKQSSTVPSLKQLALLLEVSMAEKKAEDETFVTASKEWLQLLSVEREKEKSGGKEKNKSPATAVVNGATASKVAAAGAATTAAYDDLLLQLHCLSLAVGVCH
ncbi:hypothetical protein PFISCL1PPCAC_28829, partial [Pristionchus fissidentatus]